MKKYFMGIVAFIMAMNFLFCVLGCKEAEVSPDVNAPTEVTELTATSNNGCLILSWVNPLDKDFFYVEVSMTPAVGSLSTPVILGNNISNLTVAGLSIGSEYTFTIKAFDTKLNCSEGVTVSAFLRDESDMIPPAEVTKLSAVSKDESLILSWVNPLDNDFSGVEVSMTPAEGSLATPVTLGKTVTSFTTAGLKVGQEYSFKVRTVDTRLNYSEGETVAAVVKDESDKTAPANVTELQAINKDSSVLLTWVDATDEDIYGYEVTWKTATPISRSASMAEDSIMVAPGSKGCFVNNLVNDVEYSFTVKSVDKSGNKSDGASTTVTPSIIEKSALQVELVPRITEKTNQDVVVAINATTDAASKIKKITYVEGIEAKIDDVLNGTDVTAEKEIVVKENCSYTVAVTDTAGRRELDFITIENIDKTPTSPVSNLVAGYSYSSQKITISWVNPTDEDFAGTIVSYFKSDVNPEHIHTDVSKDTTSFEIPNIEGDNSGYVIYLRPKDDVGNTAEAKIITLLAEPAPVVTNISIDKTHFDSNMADRNIEVSIDGYNFDKLTSLNIYVLDGIAYAGEVEATFDSENNTATATIKAPTPSNPTDEGKVYTVIAEINGIKYSDASASFVVSKPARVTEFVLDKTEITSSVSEKVTATIKGKNFDILGETKVAFFDSNDEEIEAKTVIVPSGNNTSANEFTVENIMVPVDKEETYKVVVIIDGVKQEVATTLKVYPKPVIDKIQIPDASISYAGQILPVTIFGKNFTTPGTTESYFISDDVKNITIINDVMLVGEVVCPSEVGETKVVITTSVTPNDGTIKVVSQDKCFAPGDIILTDGSRVSVNDVDSYTIDENNKPIGVIASAPYGGARGKAIGLTKVVKGSQNQLSFTGSDGTAGCKTSLEGIIVKFSGSTKGFTFKGDFDGSDNWAYICSIDPNGTANAEANYPAFNYANNYGSKEGITGKYATGWYLPTAVDLYDLGKNNKDVVQKSLDKAGGFLYADIGYDIYGNKINCTYLTGSQSDYRSDFIIDVETNGYIDDYFKWFSYNVVFFHDVIAE